MKAIERSSFADGSLSRPVVLGDDTYNIEIALRRVNESAFNIVEDVREIAYPFAGKVSDHARRDSIDADASNPRKRARRRIDIAGSYRRHAGNRLRGDGAKHSELAA